MRDLTRPPTLISKEEAAECGLSRYYTGKPCKYGHVAERYARNRNCVVCNAENSRLREREKGQRDPSYRMFRSVQRRSWQYLLGRVSASLAVDCDHQFLRDYIERKFTDGMHWGNYGQWEVDHIKPLSAGRTLYKLFWLCRFDNLQPLWKRDNQMKGGA